VGFQVPPVTQNAFLASTSFSTQARRANRDHEGKVIRKNYQINQRKTPIDPRRFHGKILRSDEDTFSAKGAMSALAWGIAPGFVYPHDKALKARFNGQSQTYR
jgi:hypothetical protein